MNFPKLDDYKKAAWSLFRRNIDRDQLTIEQADAVMKEARKSLA